MNDSIKKILTFVYYMKSNSVNCLQFSLKGVLWGRGIQTTGRIYIKNKGHARIGDFVRINSSPFANPIGGNERSYFQVLENARLSIGNRVSMSNVSITASKSITLGNGVMLGAGVCIFDTDFHSINVYGRVGRRFGTQEEVRAAAIVLEENVFVGTRAIILKGVVVGSNSVISAGSVVTKSIPSNEIWGGNPAKFIRKVTERELQHPAHHNLD